MSTLSVILGYRSSVSSIMAIETVPPEFLQDLCIRHVFNRHLAATDPASPCWAWLGVSCHDENCALNSPVHGLPPRQTCCRLHLMEMMANKRIYNRICCISPLSSQTGRHTQNRIPCRTRISPLCSSLHQSIQANFGISCLGTASNPAPQQAFCPPLRSNLDTRGSCCVCPLQSCIPHR